MLMHFNILSQKKNVFSIIAFGTKCLGGGKAEIFSETSILSYELG